MDNHDSIIHKLTSGNIDSLSLSEIEWLRTNLENENLFEYKELIEQCFNGFEEIEPNAEMKAAVLSKFRLSKGKPNVSYHSKTVAFRSNHLLKIAAAVIIVVAFGAIWKLTNTSQIANVDNDLNEDDFHQFTQIDDQKNNLDTLANETKYLMSMDFFSNATVALDLK